MRLFLGWSGYLTMIVTERKHKGLIVSCCGVPGYENFDFLTQTPTTPKILIFLSVSSEEEKMELIDIFSKYYLPERSDRIRCSSRKFPIYFGSAKGISGVSETRYEDYDFEVNLSVSITKFQEVKEMILDLPGYRIFRKFGSRRFLIL